jgi:hypothetical protein
MCRETDQSGADHENESTKIPRRVFRSRLSDITWSIIDRHDIRLIVAGPAPNPHGIPPFKSPIDADEPLFCQAFGCGYVLACGYDESSRCISVATRPSDFLIIAVDGFRQARVNHRSNLLLVHTKSER